MSILFQLDPMSRKPVYEQIIEQLEKYVLTKTVLPGEQIPSVRKLSLELSINPNTILKAYNELDSRGLIQSVPGKGYYICTDAAKKLTAAMRQKLDTIREIADDMALAGIPAEDIIGCIRESYKKKGAGEL